MHNGYKIYFIAGNDKYGGGYLHCSEKKLLISINVIFRFALIDSDTMETLKKSVVST